MIIRVSVLRAAEVYQRNNVNTNSNTNTNPLRRRGS